MSSPSSIQKKLCEGVEHEDDTDEFRKVQKVLAPFMRTLKKRKKVKADIIVDEYKELYLQNSPKELLKRLEVSYGDPEHLTILLNETAELLKSVTQSKCFNLYLTRSEQEEILLVTKYVPDSDRFRKRFPIETGSFLASHVAYTKEYVICADILGDMRFPKGIPYAGTTAKAALCIPIITNTQNNCIGVIELYRDYTSQPYDLVNLQICSALAAWLGIAIEQNVASLNLAKEVDIQRHIVKLTDLYFSRILSFEKIISDILKILKSSIKAERGSLYVFQKPIEVGSDEDLFADTYEEGLSEADSTILFKKRAKTKLVRNQPGLPGYAARTGEVINIRDAYKDNRFDKSKEPAFFRTRSILCLPIKNAFGVLAVLKLCNKSDYPYFRKEDVDSLQYHLTILGLVCQYYQLDILSSKNKLMLIQAERLFEYHMRPSPEDLISMKNIHTDQQQLPIGFHRFEWDSLYFEEEGQKTVALAFMQMDPLELSFDFNNLADFLLRVRKAHRPCYYHNFEHAMCTFHCVYLMLLKNKDVFNGFETLILLIAALCHDVDHSGLTNNFVSLKNDPIFQLYEDNCGEHHRFEVVMSLIQSTNLFSKIPSNLYDTSCKNLKKLILGFDLALHLQNRNQITSILNENSFDWENQEHRLLLQHIMLQCADTSYIFKPFEVTKRFTSNFFKELHQQGDLEKVMELEPLPLLDRTKSDSICESQVIFISVVCLPAIQILITMFPNLSILQDLANRTLDKWKEMITMKGQEMWKINAAITKDKKFHRVSVSRSSSIRSLYS